MSAINLNLPQVGDAAPAFEFQTPQGLLRFPEYSRGLWCVFFAHPVNFTSGWPMFSAFLVKKERWLNERNTKTLALSTVPISQNDWSEKTWRFISMHLRTPVLEDLDFRVANLYGLASGRRNRLPGCDRLALIIDPEGIIRLIITRPLMPDIESALRRIEAELERLQGNSGQFGPQPLEPVEAVEQSDATDLQYKFKPAHFPKKKIYPN